MSTKKKATTTKNTAKANAKAVKPAPKVLKTPKPAIEKPAKETKPATAKESKNSEEPKAADAIPAPTPAAKAPAKKLSLINAAYEVLASDSAALSVREMVNGAKERGLWSPGNGKTPEQTLYSSILREMKVKGEASRFIKEGRGHFKARV